MLLKDENRKNLRNQIQHTFTEQQLKDILTENEQTLRGNLYDVVEGTTYQSKLINLVRYLHQNDLINTFLKILGNENQNFASQINSLFDD
jgi:phage portal protein BeeE